MCRCQTLRTFSYTYSLMSRGLAYCRRDAAWLKFVFAIMKGAFGFVLWPVTVHSATCSFECSFIMVSTSMSKSCPDLENKGHWSVCLLHPFSWSSLTDYTSRRLIVWFMTSVYVREGVASAYTCTCALCAVIRMSSHHWWCYQSFGTLAKRNSRYLTEYWITMIRDLYESLIGRLKSISSYYSISLAATFLSHCTNDWSLHCSDSYEMDSSPVPVCYKKQMPWFQVGRGKS